MKIKCLGLIKEKKQSEEARKLILRLNKGKEKKNEIFNQNFIEWNKELIKTKDILNLKYPFEYLNPVQSEFYVNRYLDSNFLIASPTCSGKTVIAELAYNGKLLYLSPLKAISQEKLDDWTDKSHYFSTLNISISTGDYILTANRVEEMRRADIIIMTSEMLDSRSRNIKSERNDWLKDIKTLVIDEFHLIGYSGRGDKLESAIIRFTNQNPNCRLICLSATMPNVDELASWLTYLNKKKTTIISSNYRPINLIKQYIDYEESRDYEKAEFNKILITKKIIEENPNDKFIVFVHTKNLGQKILNLFKSYKIKSEFHNADLNKEERIHLQKEFNSNNADSLKVLIATSTLAWGVNTSADSVIITGLKRGMNKINNQDVHQMCGRAGRIGKTIKGVGTAYILIPSNNLDKEIEWCETLFPIKSRIDINLLEGVETLCFHILAEIMAGIIKNEKDLIYWYERTLAKFQNVEITAEDAEIILNKLNKIKMIKKDETNNWEITGLGKVSAMLYYSPFDIYDWNNNFYNLFKNNDRELTDIELAWAIGNINSNNLGYVPANCKSEIDMFIKRSQGLNCRFTAHICTTIWRLLRGDEDIPNNLNIYKRQIQLDIDRTVVALTLIDSFYSRINKSDLWDSIKWRIKYAVPYYLVDLVKLPNIGAIRAKKLYLEGIKNRKDFISNSNTCERILGSSLYYNILSSINKDIIL